MARIVQQFKVASVIPHQKMPLEAITNAAVAHILRRVGYWKQLGQILVV